MLIIERKTYYILVKRSKARFKHTTLISETEYSINFSEQQKKCYLSILCNGSDSFLFLNGVKIYQLKAKDSQLNAYPVFLADILKCFTVKNM